MEDLQWSPAEPAVLASCSADRSICVWDARAGNTKPGAKILGAHGADVNVISWNKLVNYLLVSGNGMPNSKLPTPTTGYCLACAITLCAFGAGGDDGIFRIWDLRSLRPTGEAPPPAAHFKVGRPISLRQHTPLHALHTIVLPHRAPWLR